MPKVLGFGMCGLARRTRQLHSALNLRDFESNIWAVKLISLPVEWGPRGRDRENGWQRSPEREETLQIDGDYWIQLLPSKQGVESHGTSRAWRCLHGKVYFRSQKVRLLRETEDALQDGRIMHRILRWKTTHNITKFPSSKWGSQIRITCQLIKLRVHMNYVYEIGV